MPEFFLELFSEEIPARMQNSALMVFMDICVERLSFINFRPQKFFSGPRRLAVTGMADATNNNGGIEEIRGPREGAADGAISGFLRKHNAHSGNLIIEQGYYVLKQEIISKTAAETIQTELVPALEKFPWTKSMRWGQSGDFTWIRPLRHMICLLDGDVVPLTLGPVTASNKTEGHRFLAPGIFAITSAADWQAKLRQRKVIVSADERRQMILSGLREQAASRGLTLFEDEKLLDEVTGLVEWPVPLIGKIDSRYMMLPPEVRELSMKANQRYFALRDGAEKPAPFFAFIANIEAEDGGAAIIAGNERVLRARLADAEHFWTQDRMHSLAAYMPKLNGVTFHAKLGTQYERAERIAALSREIAGLLGVSADQARQAEQAGLLAKADLVTGMVGEFPELQGIMGGYYADDPAVGAAIRTHYQPKGPDDEVPRGIVPCTVALADKLNTLISFFGIGLKPTGSGDPYALRRAALGVIRIIRENALRLHLKELCGGDHSLFAFLIERLRVLLRSQGERFDVLDAIFAAGEDDDIVSLLDKTKAVSDFIGTEDGANLLVAYRRAANILKIEDAKDGPHEGEIIEALLRDPAEHNLNQALRNAEMQIAYEPQQRGYSVLLADLATLRAPVDAFFEAIKINADDPKLRKNRLKILAKLRDIMHQIADFSKIEG